jgi:hypothetical protein
MFRAVELRDPLPILFIYRGQPVLGIVVKSLTTPSPYLFVRWTDIEDLPAADFENPEDLPDGADQFLESGFRFKRVSTIEYIAAEPRSSDALRQQRRLEGGWGKFGLMTQTGRKALCESYCPVTSAWSIFDMFHLNTSWSVCSLSALPRSHFTMSMLPALR